MFWLLPGLITGLEVLLLWRLIAWRAWRFYPIFFWYFVYVFVRTLLLMYLNIASPLSPMAYSLWFWCTGYLSVNFRFAVAWEIFKNLFDGRPVPYRATGTLLVVTMVGLAAYFYVEGSRGVSVFVDAEISIVFAIAVWLVLALFAVRYYALTPSRNVWGLGVGLGLLCASDVMSFSAWGLDERIFPIFQYVRPATFVCSLVIWLRALWSYVPAAMRADDHVKDLDALVRKHPLWQSAAESLRKALGL